MTRATVTLRPDTSQFRALVDVERSRVESVDYIPGARWLAEHIRQSSPGAREAREIIGAESGTRQAARMAGACLRELVTLVPAESDAGAALARACDEFDTFAEIVGAGD